jgi:hypothetical protein
VANVNRKKCAGEPTSQYPGLELASFIDSKNCVVTRDETSQYFVATNMSLLTYIISVQATCDKDALEYPGATANHYQVEEVFVAPCRWHDRGRQTDHEIRLRARDPVRTGISRDVEVTLSAEAAGFASIGPFRIHLQVDTE